MNLMLPKRLTYLSNGVYYSMNYAIYARVSTDIQSQFSTTDQINQCKSFIADRGGSVVSIYVDEAISGSDISRTNYQQLKRDAYNNRFDTIVVDDFSRIGRDMPEFVSFCREMDDLGIVLIGVSDGIDSSNPSSKIPLYFKGLMNELFLDDLKAKVVRGLKGQFLRGYSTGGRIYGYCSKQILDKSGGFDKFGRPKRLGCEVIIEKEQSKIVKRIFDLRRSGLGYKSIAKILNDESIPSPHAGCGSRSGLWSPGSISGILKNKKYIGIWEYNKNRWIKKSVSGKRKSIPNPEKQWVKLTSEKLRIIPDDLFKSVSIESPKRQINSSGRKKYLLSGLLVCGICGSPMTVVNSGRYSGYICQAARTKGIKACVNKRRVSRLSVEASLTTEFRKFLLDSESLQLIVNLVNEQLNKHLNCTGTNKTSLKTKRAQIKSQIDRLLDGIENGGEFSSIRERLSKREVELKQTQHELEKLECLPAKSSKITTSWLQEKLLGISSLLNEHQDKIPYVRNELRQLFPNKLKATPITIDGAVNYKINGGLNPFALSSPPNQYISIIAAQGLEPRTLGL